ncbi:MAG: putative baseplate assembly protein, partial [Pseudomonadota bacterium]
MSLNAPNLDDRTFQQLVNEMRSRIPTYCDDWTDINLSDPGITLIELFAFMGERLLYRMNQVPELHLRKFLEMLGMQRQEPIEAKAKVTFWLSKPLDTGEDKWIYNTTAVATQQSETDESIVFTVT